MARPLRIEGAGLWYHVMSRGNGGQRVFTGVKDYEAFQRAVATVREIGKTMGGVSGAAVVVAHRRIRLRMARDKRLRRILEKLS